MISMIWLSHNPHNHFDTFLERKTMKNKFNVLFAVFLGLSSILITEVHFFFLKEQSPHVVLEELFYIPLLLGAFRFGFKGGLMTYLFVSLCYLPFFFGQWSATFLDLADRVLHVLFSGVFALTAGFLSDRQKSMQKQLEKENYLAGLGQAAASIVHDLKNPLIGILGFAKRLQEGKGDVQHAANAILQSGLCMQKIVTDVLDFSRSTQLDMKEEDLVSVLLRASEVCKEKAAQEGVVVTAETPTSPVPFRMNADHFQRALVNLMDNAIDASSKGQQVQISLQVDRGPVVIQIMDQGQGMSSETMENIFVPFFTKKAGGTGLGMPIAKKTMDTHGGQIHLSSQPGQGTEVTIQFEQN